MYCLVTRFEEGFTIGVTARENILCEFSISVDPNQSVRLYHTSLILYNLNLTS